MKLIRQAIESVIGKEDDNDKHLNYLLLQYGSSYFGAETEDSDYDIVLVIS